MLCSEWVPSEWEFCRVFHCRKCYNGSWTRILARNNGFKLKLYGLMDRFLTNMQIFALQDVNWWTGVVWITCVFLWCFLSDVWLSFWWHPFTAEDPLVSKCCNATFLQMCYDEETNSYILDGLRVSKIWLLNVYLFSQSRETWQSGNVKWINGNHL